VENSACNRFREIVPTDHDFPDEIDLAFHEKCNSV
jgi:hypothetical protein